MLVTGKELFLAIQFDFGLVKYNISLQWYGRNLVL